MSIGSGIAATMQFVAMVFQPMGPNSLQRAALLAEREWKRQEANALIANQQLMNARAVEYEHLHADEFAMADIEGREIVFRAYRSLSRASLI